MRFPPGDLVPKGRFGQQAALKDPAFGKRQCAKNIFAGGGNVAGIGVGNVIGHLVRHSLNLIRLRRIQRRIVFSGGVNVSAKSR